MTGTLQAPPGDQNGINNVNKKGVAVSSENVFM